MGKTATNIIVVLGLITVAFAGYYMYTSSGAAMLQLGNAPIDQSMLNNTKIFIQHRQTLSQVQMDISLFEDERFLSLRDFSTPIVERPIGRPDPFADPAIGPAANF